MTRKDELHIIPEFGGVSAELSGFQVYRQETDHTCGPAAVRMALLYLGKDVSEKKIAVKGLSFPFGTLHRTLKAAYSHYAGSLGYSVEMSENSPDVFRRISHELSEGRPVIFIYAVLDDFHPPKKVLHYSVLTGIDHYCGTVTIANPFGHVEKMPLMEWRDRFSFSKEYLPESMSLLLKTGLLKPKTAFFLKKK